MSPTVGQTDRRELDYDNRLVTVVAGVIGGGGAAALMFSAYAADYQLRLFRAITLGPGAFLILALALSLSALYFARMGWIRRGAPHRIGLDRDSIEVPSSRLSREHVRIKLADIRAATIAELGRGYHVIDITARGDTHRIAENLFRYRADFEVVRAVLDERVGLVAK